VFVSYKLQHHVALWVGIGVLEEHATVIIRIECLCNIGNCLQITCCSNLEVCSLCFCYCESLTNLITVLFVSKVFCPEDGMSTYER